MGGASSWYAIFAITLFLACVWLAGRLSRIIGISSIVMEVAIGLILGPTVVDVIPGELSQCYDKRHIDCDVRKFQEKIANKGYYYCDLDQYLKENKYNPSGTWDTGFWGAESQVTLWYEDYEKYGGTHCLNPDDTACNSRRLIERALEGQHGNETYGLLSAQHADKDVTLNAEGIFGWFRRTSMRGGIGRKLGSNEAFRWGAVKGTQGQTKYDSYSECIKESCKLDRALKCATNPDVFTLVGHTGVAMMIFESGMHFDFEQAKTVGPWACAVAIFGTLLPLVSGCGLSVAFGFDFKEGLAAGVSLAPTSVGIALKLLHEARALQLYFGQAVMTAAFVDDVLSLILFSVLFSLGDSMDFWTFVPLITGCLFMVITIAGAVTIWPPFVKWMLRVIPEDKPDNKVTRHDEVLFIVMLVTVVAYAEITHECGTHLWGCFIAGMNFSTMHHAHHVWVRQVKRYTCWWLRIFFACTLAWSIPVEELFDPDAIWKGTIMGIGPCIAAKVFCAPFMGSARWAIGWAMVGRAEFAYFIAIMAKSLGMMPDDLFAILLWALIYATIFAPLLFRKVLARYMASQGEQTEAWDGSGHGSEPHSILGGEMVASGHLPDLEAIEELKHSQEQKRRFSDMQNSVHLQNEEMQKLVAQLEEVKDKMAILQAENAILQIQAKVVKDEEPVTIVAFT